MPSTVRNLTPEELGEYKNKLRSSLKTFHDFCETHGLTYYLSDGTLLGAIRHKGMIPWDDDIDVCMPREDYSRLELLSQSLPSELSLASFNKTANYMFPYIKISHPAKHYCEVIGAHLHATGAWLDIFPLDGTYKNKGLRKTHYLAVKVLRSAFNLKTRGWNTIKGQNGTAKSKLKKLLFLPAYAIAICIPKNILFSCMDGIARHKPYNRADIAGNLYTSIGIRASHDKNIFSERTEYLFDGMLLYGPSGSHQYLKNLYGDYQTPSPPSARQQHNIRKFS